MARPLNVAVFGRVNTGKSTLCNALFGLERFSTSAVAGHTGEAESHVGTLRGKPITIIDTPGFGEAGGEERAQTALFTAMGADLVLFVLSGPATREELDEMRSVLELGKPGLLVLNRVDQLTRRALGEAWGQICQQFEGLIDPANRFQCASIQRAGRERERLDGTVVSTGPVPPEVAELEMRIVELSTIESQELQELNLEGQRLLGAALVRSRVAAILQAWLQFWDEALAENVECSAAILAGPEVFLPLIQALDQGLDLKMSDSERLQVAGTILATVNQVMPWATTSLAMTGLFHSFVGDWFGAKSATIERAQAILRIAASSVAASLEDGLIDATSVRSHLEHLAGSDAATTRAAADKMLRTYFEIERVNG